MQKKKKGRKKKAFSSGRCPVKIETKSFLSSLKCDYRQGTVPPGAWGRGSTKTKKRKMHAQIKAVTAVESLLADVCVWVEGNGCVNEIAVWLINTKSLCLRALTRAICGCSAENMGKWLIKWPKWKWLEQMFLLWLKRGEVWASRPQRKKEEKWGGKSLTHGVKDW